MESRRAPWSAPPPGAELLRFREAWFCRGPIIQSVWGSLFRRFPLFAWRRERWETPDSDFLDLDFLDSDRPDAPTLLLLHGLEGSSESHYMKGLAREAARRGWRAAALNFRSCGGEMNRRPRLYHSGETQDLAFVAGVLSRRFAGPLLLAGFSLGGNVLLKWLGERGGDLPGAVRGAACVSPPYDIAAAARRLDSPVGAFFRKRLLPALQQKVCAFARRHPGRVDAERARRAETFAEFDRWATAPIHGFTDEEDYYSHCSSSRYLPHVRLPVLLINSEDDPVVPADSIPQAEIRRSAWLRGALVPAGGHVGFVGLRRPWRASYWAEECAAAFLAGCLGGAGRPAAAEENRIR